MDTTLHETAILANVSSLRSTLAAALERATEAEAIMQDGHTNQAIGAAIGIETLIEDAAALYRAAIALHRSRHKSGKAGAA
jgi:hypothetical protein